jgi:hypothetical protein
LTFLARFLQRRENAQAALATMSAREQNRLEHLGSSLGQYLGTFERPLLPLPDPSFNTTAAVGASLVPAVAGGNSQAAVAAAASLGGHAQATVAASLGASVVPVVAGGNAQAAVAAAAAASPRRVPLEPIAEENTDGSVGGHDMEIVQASSSVKRSREEGGIYEDDEDDDTATRQRKRRKSCFIRVDEHCDDLSELSFSVVGPSPAPAVLLSAGHLSPQANNEARSLSSYDDRSLSSFEQVDAIARRIGGGAPPTPETYRTATDIMSLDVQRDQNRQNNMANQIRLASVHQQHNHNLILGTGLVEDHQQRGEHHGDIQEQRNEHHGDIQEQRNEHHAAEEEQRNEHHAAEEEQRNEHRDLEMERTTANSRIKFYTDASIFVLTLCCLLAFALVSHHHMTNFMEDPCPYFEQWSPFGSMTSGSKWWRFGIGIAGQANCVMAMIWVALALFFYAVVTHFLPTEVNSLLFSVVFCISVFKLLQDKANQIIGILLCGLIIPPAMGYLYAVLSLHDELDDCVSSIELKRARKKFEKIMKRIWGCQCICMVFAGIVFAALGSSKSHN